MPTDNPIYGSRTANKLVQVLRDSLDRINGRQHPNTNPNRRPDQAQQPFRPVHTPDRPARTTASADIPSDAEIIAFLEAMPRAEEERRAREREVREVDTRLGRSSISSGSVNGKESAGAMMVTVGDQVREVRRTRELRRVGRLSVSRGGGDWQDGETGKGAVVEGRGNNLERGADDTGYNGELASHRCPGASVQRDHALDDENSPDTKTSSTLCQDGNPSTPPKRLFARRLLSDEQGRKPGDESLRAAADGKCNDHSSSSTIHSSVDEYHRERIGSQMTAKRCSLCRQDGILDGRTLCQACAMDWDSERSRMRSKSYAPPPPLPKDNVDNLHKHSQSVTGATTNDESCHDINQVGHWYYERLRAPPLPAKTRFRSNTEGSPSTQLQQAIPHVAHHAVARNATTRTTNITGNPSAEGKTDHSSGGTNFRAVAEVSPSLADPPDKLHIAPLLEGLRASRRTDWRSSASTPAATYAQRLISSGQERGRVGAVASGRGPTPVSRFHNWVPPAAQAVADMESDNNGEWVDLFDCFWDDGAGPRTSGFYEAEARIIAGYEEEGTREK